MLFDYFSIDVVMFIMSQNLLRQIIAMTEKITHAEGSIRTIIPFLTINRHTYSSPLTPSVLTLILQGMKEIHLGKEMIYYDAGDYVAALIDMPASGQVVNASAASPFIGLRIDFTTKETASVAMEIESNVKHNKKSRAPELSLVSPTLSF